MGLVTAFKAIKSWIGAAWAALDVRDLLVYGGLFSIGWGSYLIRPAFGFIVWGIVSMLLGLGWILRVRK